MPRLKWATLEQVRAKGLPCSAPVAALGMFDGVHRGHAAIIERTVRLAKTLGGDPIVFTFDRHPSEIIPGRPRVPQLSSLESRLRLFAERGAVFTVVATFDAAFAQLDPDAFIEDILVRTLGIRGAVCGFDFRFGRRAGGDAELLQRKGRELGFDVVVVDPVIAAGTTVSSTEIRQRLEAGDVATAATLLGRPYRLPGKVIRGQGEGRKLGFPTANIEVTGNLLLPADGVYAGEACWHDDEGFPVRRPAVNVISTRPTFGEHPRALEVHVPGFDGDLYGRRIEVSFHYFVRGIVPFPSLEALKAQMEIDVARAVALMKGREGEETVAVELPGSEPR